MNFIVEINSKCGQGGGGQKSPKMLRMSLMDGTNFTFQHGGLPSSPLIALMDFISKHMQKWRPLSPGLLKWRSKSPEQEDLCIQSYRERWAVSWKFEFSRPCVAMCSCAKEFHEYPPVVGPRYLNIIAGVVNYKLFFTICMATVKPCIQYTCIRWLSTSFVRSFSFMKCSAAQLDNCNFLLLHYVGFMQDRYSYPWL